MKYTLLVPKDAKSPQMDALVAIYDQALPACERKSRNTLEDMLHASYYRFYVGEDEGEVRAFAIIYAPQGQDHGLLEYLATDHRCRSQGYGGQFMRYLNKEFQGRHMLIEADSPHQPSEDHAIRLKRLRFYQRHGNLEAEGLTYLLPLDTHGTPPEMVLLLQSPEYTTTVPKERLRYWLTDIYTTVYRCAANDPRLDKMLNGLAEAIRLT